MRSPWTIRVQNSKIAMEIYHHLNFS